MIRWNIILPALFFFLPPAVVAMETGRSVFVVQRVPVEARAQSAAQAKELAHAGGRRRAMDILLRRLAVTQERSVPAYSSGCASPLSVTGTGREEILARSPEPGSIDGGSGFFAGKKADEAAFLPDMRPGNEERQDTQTVLTADLHDHELERYISALEIHDEKSSPHTYRAHVTYTFNPAAVRGLLRDLEIPYSETQTDPVLVLPVFRNGDKLYLWEEENPWMDAWRNRPYDNELVPVIVPLGDLEDRILLTARGALFSGEETLPAMARRYMVSRVFVAYARLFRTEEEDSLYVYLIDGPGNGDAAGVYRSPDVAAVSGPDYPDTLFEDMTGSLRNGGVRAGEYFTGCPGNFPELAGMAVEAVILDYAMPWKKANLINHASPVNLDVRVFFRSLEEWVKIRSALPVLSVTGSIRVRSFSGEGARLSVQSYAAPDRFSAVVRSSGFASWPDAGGGGIIVTTLQREEAVRKRLDGKGARRPDHSAGRFPDFQRPG